MKQPGRGSALRIIVLGYIVRGPLGGMTWHHLQYVLGLIDLGHDVYFLEDSDDYASCYDPTTHAMTKDPSYGLRYAAEVFDRAGLRDRWGYHDRHTGRWHGPATEREVWTNADVVLNVSGVNPLREWYMRAPIRVLVDTDPVFTQIRHLTDEAARRAALKHNRFFTFGENFGSEPCAIPDDGLPWQPSRQPIVLDAWPACPVPRSSHFTTVMQWESYPAQSYAGVSYGMKAQSFSEYLDLPQRVDQTLELALGGATAPRDVLRHHGWRIIDSVEVTRDPWQFRSYLQQSSAEFAVAKQGYVASQSGWFSERSANYLASGRAVVMQDTGFTRTLPVGCGLWAFSNAEQAIDAIRTVASDAVRQGAAAREIAHQHFDAKRVLADLLRACERDAAQCSEPCA